MKKRGTKKKILMVASSGGHWTQLNLLNTAFNGHERIYVTTDSAYRSLVKDAEFYTVPDATRWDKIRLIVLMLKMFWIILLSKPDIVISTGAAPGFFALFFAKMIGKKTIWVDSIANVDKLSLSGVMVKKYADLWLTQWEHLARPEGPHYAGSVI